MGYWKKIGTLPVDSGQMMLVDPCYVLSAGDEHKGPDYYELIGQWKDDDRNQHGVPVTQDAFTAGWVTGTGYGDGEYPLWAWIEDGRVIALFVQFGEMPPGLPESEELEEEFDEEDIDDDAESDVSEVKE